MDERTRQELLQELKSLQARIEELERVRSDSLETEELLHHVEEKWGFLFENIPDIVMNVSRDGTILAINHAVGDFTVEEIVGSSIYKFVAPQYCSPLRECLESVFRAGIPDSYEIMGTGPAGPGSAWYETRLMPIRLNQQIHSVTLISADITERKHAEEAMKESEEKYRTLVENINIGAYRNTGDFPGRFLHANPAIVKMFGYGSVEEFMQISVCELYQNPHERKLFLEDLLKNGFVKGKELRLRKKDGTPIWASCTAKVQYDENKRIKWIDGVVEDVTERKKAEEALQESEGKYSSLVEQAQEGVVILQDGVFKFCNKAMSDITGYSTDELIGMDFLPAILPKYKELIKKRYEADIAGKTTPQTFIIKTRRKDGKIIDIEATGSTIYFHDRPAAMCVLRDITERIKAEGALRESEHKYRTLLKNIPHGIFYKDLNSVYMLCNESYASDLNIGPAEIKGKTDYDFYPKELADKYRADDKRIIESGRSEELEEEYLRGGQRVAVQTLKSPVRDEQGNIIGIFGIFWDITERKKNKRRLELLNRELVRTNKRLKSISVRDMQTGLYNHRYLEEVLDAEFYRAKRYGHPLSVIMLDVDYFKSINDVYGHKFGDLVLKQLARLLKRMVRRYDVVIRFGGEEFLIICPGIDYSPALILAQRILDAINLYSFGNKKHIVKARLSMAVVNYPQDRAVNQSMDLLELAEQVLDKAKEHGGNCVYSSADINNRKECASIKDEGSSDICFLKEKITKLTKRSNQSLVEAVFAFAKTIKLKDSYTGVHVERIVGYATEIAQTLNLSKDDIELIRQAAILHDLGKIGISDRILLKAGPLSKREFNKIKHHPQIGVDIIRPIQFLHSIIPFILYHHERWDGNGYPKGLKGEEIPVGARIVAIADVYQALISDRPYRRAFSKDKAVKIIQGGSGTQFDPHIVSAFLKIIKHNKHTT
ncbi:PAS domain S-box protein [Candidatus Omnitrophota bacterium]